MKSTEMKSTEKKFKVQIYIQETVTYMKTVDVTQEEYEELCETAEYADKNGPYVSASDFGLDANDICDGEIESVEITKLKDTKAD